MRLYNFLKNNLFLTKSELFKFYEENEVFVNEIRQNLTYNVKETDVITINGVILENNAFRYFLYNKPVGVLCNNDRSKLDSYLNKIKLTYRLFMVGRLDKNSCGLIILTNDGKYASYILSSKVEKEYEVGLLNPIDLEFMKKINGDFVFRGKHTKAKSIKIIDEYKLNIVLTNGLYHEIRKMVISSGNTVTALKRIRIGNLLLDDLEENNLKEFNLY